MSIRELELKSNAALGLKRNDLFKDIFIWELGLKRNAVIWERAWTKEELGVSRRVDLGAWCIGPHRNGLLKNI